MYSRQKNVETGLSCFQYQVSHALKNEIFTSQTICNVRKIKSEIIDHSEIKKFN